MAPTIGVLALQGDFEEHMHLLHSIGAGAAEIRSRPDLSKCAALIIPGGESTTISRLMLGTGLDKEIKSRVRKGMPVYGTCAGAILVAKKVLGEKRFRPLGLIGIEVERNAYGRQVDSFEANVEMKNVNRDDPRKIRGVFIRAPVFRRIDKSVEVLASFGGRPVLVRQGNVIAGTFHPEIAGEKAVHELLLRLI